MTDTLRVTGANYMTVAVKDISTSKVMEFVQYHGYPTNNLDNLFNFANWCSQRGFKTYIYVENEQPFFWKLLFSFTFWLGFFWKLLFSFTFWLGKKCGKFHSELTRGCP